MDNKDQGGAQAVGGCGRLHLLGIARFERTDGSTLRLEERDALLLAMLAIEGEQYRSSMAARLWPDVPIERARGNLRQRLLRLRRTVGDEMIVGGSVLTLSPRVQVDLHNLPSRFQDAAAAPLGELLAGIEAMGLDELRPWLEAVRQQHRVACVEGWLASARRHGERGERAEASACLDQAIALDPTDERAHLRLIQLHYEAGNRSAALSAYERCERVLWEQLGVAPGPQAQSLLRLVRAAAAPSLAVQDKSPSPPDAWHAAIARPPRLVGRHDAWAALQSAARSGHCVLVSGAGGIGKSRLLTEWANESTDTLVVCARPGDEHLPYGLVTRLLREGLRRWSSPLEDAVRRELARLLPQLGPPPSTPAAPSRIGWAIAAAVQQWHAQGLRGVALDDLQHADASSLAWLLPWAAEAMLTPIAVMLASRETEMPAALRDWAQAHEAGPPADRAVDPSPGTSAHSPSPRRVVRIRLNPLTQQDLLALTSDLQSALGPVRLTLPSPESLWRHTGGNPWFVLRTLQLFVERELAAPGSSPTPLPAAAELKTLLARQLTQLSARAQALAQVAAVCGDAFDAELAATALNISAFELAAPWQELESTQWMTEGRLTHDLMTEAVQASIPPSLLPQLHAAVATQLAARRAPASVLARHWHAAARWKEAAQAYEAAAAESALRSAIEQQLAMLDAAVDCHHRDRTALPGAAFDAALQAASLTLEQLRADATLARCEILLRNAVTRAQRAAVWQLRARAHMETSSFRAALDAARQALDLLGAETADSRVGIFARLHHVSARLRLGEGAAALEELDPGDDMLQALSLDDRLAWLTEYATLLDLADRGQEAAATLGRLAEEARRAERWIAAGTAYCNQSVAWMYLGRTEAGRQAVEAGLACYRHSTLEASALLVDQMNLVGFLRDQGRFTECLPLAEQLPAGLRAAGYVLWGVNAENDLAVTYCWLGRPDLAYRVMHGDLPHDSPRLVRAIRMMVKAMLARDHGVSLNGHDHHDRLTHQAATILREEGALGRTYIRLKVELECARADGPTAEEARLVALEREAEQRQQYMLLAHARLHRIQRAHAGQSPDTTQTAQELLEQCERDGTPPGLYPPQVWWALAQALWHRDPQTSTALRQRARRWVLDTAAQHVPDLFRHSFLQGNATNRAILGCPIHGDPPSGQ